ncbi:hypothetical protein [Arthrobacter sp. PM3]|uniref:hypothetical protein n=1 Tax=Arthrobacter sp. PM3 TaxID=2017685 RepID=UPI000E10DE96|nr:hypothetical protein [Arthrobacter sp. PM3]AXJ11158.1 hypothetical protein CFN17_17240 [Arthrobacter sp. PM3]
MRVLVAETVAMFAIGDGALGVIFPVQHCTRWATGPQPWRSCMRWFADHPGLTRSISAVQIVAGISCAARLPSTPR